LAYLLVPKDHGETRHGAGPINMKRALTVAAVERLKPPRKGQVDVFDKGYPGLALRISYGGHKSWCFFYTRAGKVRRLKLGSFSDYPFMSLAAAREAWREARAAVAEGNDPAQQEPTTAAMGFPEVVAEWLKRDQAGNKASTQYAVKRVVEFDLLPAWGNRRIDQIGKRDVLDLLDGIIDRGASSKANRVYAHLSCFFKWCLSRDIISVNPIASISRPGSNKVRDRVLTGDELGVIYRSAADLGPVGAVVRLLALTGARLNEIARLKWSEIDGDVIRLEGDRTKNGRPYIIPLSAPARAVIGTVVPIQGCEYVFSTDGRKPLNSWGRAKYAIDKACGVTNWRLHDLRRTCATGMAEHLGIEPHIVEAVLNHVSGHKAGVAGTYNRATYSKEKTAALEMWGAHVVQLERAVLEQCGR
jgi:integrase